MVLCEIPRLSFALLLQVGGPLQRLLYSHLRRPASLLLPLYLCSMTLLPLFDPVCKSLSNGSCVL